MKNVLPVWIALFICGFPAKNWAQSEFWSVVNLASVRITSSNAVNDTFLLDNERAYANTVITPHGDTVATCGIVCLEIPNYSGVHLTRPRFIEYSVRLIGNHSNHLIEIQNNWTPKLNQSTEIIESIDGVGIRGNESRGFGTQMYAVQRGEFRQNRPWYQNGLLRTNFRNQELVFHRTWDNTRYFLWKFYTLESNVNDTVFFDDLFNQNCAVRFIDESALLPEPPEFPPLNVLEDTTLLYPVSQNSNTFHVDLLSYGLPAGVYLCQARTASREVTQEFYLEGFQQNLSFEVSLDPLNRFINDHLFIRNQQTGENRMIAIYTLHVGDETSPSDGGR